MHLLSALDRLNSQLPLKARQAVLAPEFQAVHRAVIRSLVLHGHVPGDDELQALCGGYTVADVLRRLGEQDLVVLDPHRGTLLGAYPVTSEVTPHRLHVQGHDIFAMCALDALSVAPMFATAVCIESHCQLSDTPIRIEMQDELIRYQAPAEDLHVGIRWQMPTSVAAHSMCLQMIFLKDYATALRWQAGDTQNNSLFGLNDAVAFGKAFFRPLLE